MKTHMRIMYVHCMVMCDYYYYHHWNMQIISPTTIESRETIGNFDIGRSLPINIQIIFNEKIDNFPTLVIVVVVVILDKNLDNGQNLNGFRFLSHGGSFFHVCMVLLNGSDCIPVPPHKSLREMAFSPTMQTISIIYFLILYRFS